MLEVVGASFGRTGTHSLAAALEALGFGPCYHMLEFGRQLAHAAVWVDAMEGRDIDWLDFFQPYRSSVEWPVVSFLDQILPVFPQAKVILTLRDAEDWYESAAETIFEGLELSQANPDPARRNHARVARRLILDATFSRRHGEKAHAVAVYERHVERVSDLVPNHRLLHYRVSDGWQPLCAFLDVNEPGEAFPWLNERSEFKASEPAWATEARIRIATEGETPAPNED